MVQDFKPTFDTQSLSPLRRFKGVLEKYEGIPGKDQTTGREYMSVEFSFSDLEVLESTELYPFPIAQIRIGYSRSANTRWDALGKSMRALSGPQAEPDALVGKRQEWAMLPGKLRVLNQETQVWEDAMQDCWQVVSVEGLAPPEDLTDYIVGMADGKSEQQFNQLFLQDAKLRERSDLITALTERKLLEPLLLGNRLSRDAEGVLHKV